MHGARLRRGRVAVEPAGGGGHARAGEQQGDEQRPDPRRSHARATHQAATFGPDRRRPRTPAPTTNSDHAERHPQDDPRGAVRTRELRHVESRRDRARLAEPARVHGQVVHQVARGRVDVDLREPHVVGGQPLHAAVRPEIGEQRGRRGLADLLDQPALIGVAVGKLGQRKGGRLAIGQQEYVRLHQVGLAAPERQDAQRHPWVRGGDDHVDRRALALLDALVVRAADVELDGHEDRAALGVERQHLRRVGREEEAVIARPRAHVDRAALQHRDVERVDLRLEQHDRARRPGCPPRRARPERAGWSR